MKKRGQYTLEFVIIFSVVFLSFLIILAFLVQYIDRSQRASNYKTLDAFAESIREDIILADESSAKFESKINIPDNLYGEVIEVKVDVAADVLYVKNTYSDESVYKPLPDVDNFANPGHLLDNIQGTCLKILMDPINGGVITLEKLASC